MTRDQAIEKFSHTRFHIMGERRSETWIEMFVALGMLKLDEPKSADQKFIEAIEKHGFYKSVGEQVLGAINAAGLKIVEK